MSPSLRNALRIGLILCCVGLATSAFAKKKKQAPLKVNPGGASQRWSCDQVAESACDLAKRCEPDKSLRHCKKLRDRCSKVKERPSRTATEDDVTVCAHAISDLTCKQVSFDNTSGVDFDIKKIEACAVIAKDNPLPAAAGAEKDKDADDDDAKDTKEKGDDGDE